MIGLITIGAPDFGGGMTAVYFNEAAREERYAVVMALLQGGPGQPAAGS